MTERDKYLNGPTDTELEELFSLARDNPPVMSVSLNARIMRDAADQDFGRSAVHHTESHLRNRLYGLLSGYQGWSAATAMVSAVFLGLWMGLNPPALFDGATLFDGANDLYLTEVYADMSVLTEDM